MSNGVIFSSNEASKGGFQAVLAVQGKLVSIERVASKFETNWDGEGTPPDQAEVTLEDAMILEMGEGEPEPELKDGKFTFWMTYAQPGKPKPHKNTFYVKGFLASGEKLGIFPDWRDKFVTLRRQEVVLFKRRNDAGELEEIKQSSFVFVGEEASGQAPIDDYVKELIVGKNKSSALRAVLMDNRAKQYSDIVSAVRDGSIDVRLGLKVDSKGVYQLSDEGSPVEKKTKKK